MDDLVSEAVPRPARRADRGRGRRPPRPRPWRARRERSSPAASIPSTRSSAIWNARTGSGSRRSTGSCGSADSTFRSSLPRKSSCVCAGASRRRPGTSACGSSTSGRISGRPGSARLRWGNLSHGPALAGVGLALERRFETFYIAATHESGEIGPWGSHPDIDPLFSTRSTRFVHDGAGPRRSDKTERISRSDVAMRSLHVCFRSGTADNCCDCRKCLLAMLTLEVFGVLSGCPAFPRPLDLERVRRVYLRSPSYWRLYTDILVRARKAGRKDIAKAIAACRLRYLYTKPAIKVIDWLAARRGLWRVARRLRPRSWRARYDERAGPDHGAHAGGARRPRGRVRSRHRPARFDRSLGRARHGGRRRPGPALGRGPADGRAAARHRPDPRGHRGSPPRGRDRNPRAEDSAPVRWDAPGDGPLLLRRDGPHPLALSGRRPNRGRVPRAGAGR